jgi:succinate dehydrogenase / fumarate reductase cytochrome b subunit
MSGIKTVVSSSVGRKLVMAVTGLALFGFVLGHMAGNLQVFQGPEAMNAYGAFLHEFLHGAGIWFARGGLLAAVALHIWAAVSLTLENFAARPDGYRRVRHVESTYASRTMIWSGPILAMFVIYHLLHLTTGQAHSHFVPGDVYRNVVIGFSSPPVTIAYTVAMLALGLHLYHGIWSMLQTLGLNHPAWNRARWAFAAGATVLIVAGFLSVPFAVIAGVVR